WLELDTFAATAFAGLVGVLEGETGFEDALLEIHHRAEKEQRGLGLDEHLDALLRNMVVAGDRRVDIAERIGLPRAAGVLDADAHTHHRLVGVRDDLAHPLRRRIREAHDLEGHRIHLPSSKDDIAPFGRYHQLSATLASSLIRLASHGGSNTMLTVTPEIPSTESAAFSTQPGMSPATGHPGAVNVMSMVRLRLSS